MSRGIMVTLLAWMAQRLVSSNKPTRYASAASCCTFLHYMSFLHYREVFCTDWLSFGKIKSLKILDNYILFVQTDNCHVPTQYGLRV